MSPDKRKRTKKAAGKRPARKLQAVKSDESGPPYIVRWHPEAASERGTAWPPREKVAMQHAVDKLEAVGSRLMHPHSSAVQGRSHRRRRSTGRVSTGRSREQSRDSRGSNSVEKRTGSTDNTSAIVVALEP